MTEYQKVRIRLYGNLLAKQIRVDRKMLRDALRAKSEGKIGRHIGGLVHWLK